MLNENILGLIVCGIALLIFIGLIIYIVHCFPLQIFIIIGTLVVLLLFNEVKYIS